MDDIKEINERIKKKVLSYLAIISWLTYELNEIAKQDKKMNLFLNEDEIKEMDNKEKLY